MSDITLSKAVRSNLLSLQNTASMMSKTQERLATGNKVNSALDNPTNFFTAASLNSRANDINALMDGMANGIQTLEAADNGLTAITKTLESMQSTLRQARQDKSFQTASYELPSGAAFAAGSKLSFQGGAVGDTAVDINLTKGTAGTSTTGTFSSFTLDAETDATSGGVTASGTFAQITFDDAGDVLSFDIDVDGATQTFAFDQADVTAALGKNTIDNVDELAELINTKLSGATASNDGGSLRIQSDTTGAGSSVDVNSVQFDDDGNGAAAFDDTGFDGTNGQAGDPGVDAQTADTITFDIAVDGGNATTVTLTAAQVAAVGNGDQTVDSLDEFQAVVQAALTAAGVTGVTVGQNDDGTALTFASSSLGTGSSVAITNATANDNNATVALDIADTGLDATTAVAGAAEGGATKSVDELVTEINNNPDLKGKIRASNDNGKLRIENQSTQELDIGGISSTGAIDGASTSDAGKIAGNAVRADLAKQYNELRDQLDKLADDASFNGINLLRGDNLKITFNETGTSELDIQSRVNDESGVSINSATLGLETNMQAEDFDSDADIDGFLGRVKEAINKVRSQASAFGSSLSIVQNRQDFSKNMINTLQTGASNLTLADANEEAANLLALQTRQQLSSTALSMASQADQAVLRLF